MDWIIYLIIFGLISSMLNKQKKRPSEPKQPHRPQTIEETDWPIPFPDLEREWPGYELEEEIDNKMENWDTKRIEQIDEKKVQETVPEIKPDKKIEAAQAGIEMDQLHKKYIAAEPTANQVIQGVVWSEILGAPRSKRPHHASLHQRK